MAKDKFLQDKVKENEDGCKPRAYLSANFPTLLVGVTLECLLTFNRLKSLSTDPAVIVTAVRKSKSDTVEVCISCGRGYKYVRVVGQRRRRQHQTTADVIGAHRRLVDPRGETANEKQDGLHSEPMVAVPLYH